MVVTNQFVVCSMLKFSASYDPHKMKMSHVVKLLFVASPLSMQ
jgi:hypothetical protein